MNWSHPNGHYWQYCDYCEAWMVICGRCGNNCCNGGYGEEIGPEPGTLIQCRLCEEAYALQASGEGQPTPDAPKE